MSRWAEFLGDDYMTTHGRFVPYGHWKKALLHAWSERIGETIKDPRDPETSCVDLLQPQLWEDANLKDLLFSITLALQNDYRGFVDKSDPTGSVVTLAAIETMIGPCPAAPGKFEPYTAEYLWWIKRALDCCTMRAVGSGQSNYWQMRFSVGTLDCELGAGSIAAAIARAEANTRWGDSGGNAIGTNILYSHNDYNEFYVASRHDHLRLPLYLDDQWILTPDAKLEVWIRLRAWGEHYWQPEGIPEHQWVRIDRRGGSLSQFQDHTLELFDHVEWPPNVNMGWLLDDCRAFVDLRPGLEFYDPI